MRMCMNALSVFRRTFARRSIAALGLGAVVASLAGCYVVPVDPRTGQPVPVASAAPVAAPAAAQPVTFPVRLYPANEQAGGYGVINASVTNDLHGRGNFNANINGESFVGEATRKPGFKREGQANGAGNRGSYLSCEYVMNTATLGAGTCRLNNGAVFSMHVGN